MIITEEKLNCELMQLLENPKKETKEYYDYCKWLANFLINDFGCLVNKFKLNNEDIGVILGKDAYTLLAIKLAYHSHDKKWLVEFFKNVIGVYKNEIQTKK